jgi:hypothetical protein
MKKRKRLKMDGKKRITLGKLISKDTTFFEVEKQKDGTIILYPKTNLSQKEILLYKDKVAFSSLKKGISDVKKGLITKINNDFWAGV